MKQYNTSICQITHKNGALACRQSMFLCPILLFGQALNTNNLGPMCIHNVAAASTIFLFNVSMAYRERGTG